MFIDVTLYSERSLIRDNCNLNIRRIREEMIQYLRYWGKKAVTKNRESPYNYLSAQYKIDSNVKNMVIGIDDSGFSQFYP